MRQRPARRTRRDASRPCGRTWLPPRSVPTLDRHGLKLSHVLPVELTFPEGTGDPAKGSAWHTLLQGYEAVASRAGLIPPERSPANIEEVSEPPIQVAVS